MTTSGDNRTRLAAASNRPGAVSQDFPRPSKLAFRRGLTLIEVMLVLALLVVIAALGWPAINNAFSNQRLKKAADIVRTQWCKSRVKAMSTDRIVLFRYEMNGGRFRLEQLIDVTSFENLSDGEAPDANATSNAAPGGDPTAISTGGAMQNADYAAIQGAQTLPEGIVFYGGEIENDSRSMTAAATPSNAATDTSWSEPVYFYPDGTSSNIRLQIRNDRNRAIELTLRGMTGVVKVGEIAAVEGAMP